MINKKLAALLASAVMLGQAGLMSGVFAQTQATNTTSNSQESLQLASVISHPDFNVSADQAPQGQPSDTTDVFTIGNGPGTLPTVIQVLPQDDSTTSLFLNGTEILRFQGEVAGLDSYTRVKTIASRLNQLLENNPQTAQSIRPALVNNLPVIQADNQTLVTVDAQTAKATQESPLKLALLYSNRLRQALGQTALDDKVLESLAENMSNYKGTGKVQTGMASWYGPYFHGRRSADGSRFNQFALTAAHRTLPFGTIVRVINQRTRKSCYVKITDRGPFAHGRIIDLSRGAAKKIDMLGSGVARVSVEVVQKRG
ncbi:septal ring lytic transglycosylase RlpA family protein [Vampirovibrio chlorellavorus]|uniref:septal ring lytic transglycosylase RlpA family protein n=1 Tax=Vampirovibrio chlorellavorus TaxID=758823 RepID=UPI0026EFCB05|nr:septal ring lytic transglycosylase RlpA family protein [Vampirovibrio chlorellavorus]